MNDVILALDLGTTIGWAYHQGGVTESGVTTLPSPKKGRSTIPDDHVGLTYYSFAEWLKSYPAYIKPTLVAYEEPMGNFKNAGARNIIVGMRGILMAWTAKYDIPITSIPQTKLKKFATGKGNADKAAMLHAAQEMLDPEVIDYNEADALWVLQWALSTRALSSLKS